MNVSGAFSLGAVLSDGAPRKSRVNEVAELLTKIFTKQRGEEKRMQREDARALPLCLTL